MLVIALSAAFAANPIGAVVHAWAHTAASSDDQGKTSHHGHDPCELCAAYAALEQAGLAMPLTGVAAAPDAPLAVATPADTSVRTQFAYRPRAPPHLLCTT